MMQERAFALFALLRDLYRTNTAHEQ